MGPPPFIAVCTLLLIAACAAPRVTTYSQNTPSAETGAREVPAVALSYGKKCAGALPADTVVTKHLDDSDVVTEATVCAERAERVPGDGEWMARRVAHLRGDAIGALSAALHEHIPELSGACAGVGWDTPVWAVTLADGRHVQPQMPSDGCAPPRATLDALQHALAGPAVVVTRDRQTQPETQVASGCYDGVKFFVPTDRSPVVDTPTPPRWEGPTTVCRFDMSDGSGVDGPGGGRLPLLAGTGASPAVGPALDAVYATFRTGKPASCTTDRPTAVLTVQPPNPAGAEQTGPRAYIEVGGCGLVLNGALEVIGSVAPAPVERLSRLATDRVMTPVEY